MFTNWIGVLGLLTNQLWGQRRWNILTKLEILWTKSGKKSIFFTINMQIRASINQKCGLKYWAQKSATNYKSHVKTQLATSELRSASHRIFIVHILSYAQVALSETKTCNPGVSFRHLFPNTIYFRNQNSANRLNKVPNKRKWISPHVCWFFI